MLGADAPDPGLVEAMNAAILHRGPDHGAVEAYGRCVLGYRRLSIIDLRSGDQPVASESGEVVAVFNGELYNFRELRRELEGRGHRIAGSGDSPLIPHAYEEWGAGFAARLEGMFAIALWDRGAERLVLARDRLGKKPLCYAWLPDGSFAFASETKALLALPALPRELDLDQIDAYLALQYVPRSALRSVERLAPGSVAVLERGSLRSERYWTPRPAAASASEPEWIERVRDEVRAAVARRLVADVPVGALLSGGIDSSVVVAAMAAASAEPVATFSVGFPDRRYDERRFARLVAERYGTRHTELELDPRPELLERLAEAFDEPFGDEAALPTLLVCEATRRHVKVALVGDGGDEVFGGYERYRALALAAGVPRLAASLGASALGALPAARREPRSRLFRGRRFLEVAALQPQARYGRLLEVFPRELRARLLERRGAGAANRGAAGRRQRTRAAGRHRVLPARRPVAQGRHRLDGRLVSFELRAAAARPPRRRARARASTAARPRQAGAPARLRARPSPGDPPPRQDGLRRSARALVPGGAAPARAGAPARQPRARTLRAQRARAAA